MVSGLLNTSRQVGGSLALAVLTTVASRASHHSGQNLNAVAHGYSTAFLSSAALLCARPPSPGLCGPAAERWPRKIAGVGLVDTKQTTVRRSWVRPPARVHPCCGGGSRSSGC